MKDKILGYTLAFGSYLLRKVLLIDLALLVLVGLSFLVWGGFSVAALSERLVWSGIGVAMIAGILVLGQTTGGRNYGMNTWTAAQSSTLIEWNIEIRKNIDQRFDYRFQIFFIGAFLFLAGVLVDLIF